MEREFYRSLGVLLKIQTESDGDQDHRSGHREGEAGAGPLDVGR